jgi:hypothetical protein
MGMARFARLDDGGYIMVSGRLWLWAQELEQSPAQLPKQREKRIEYSGTVNMMGSGSIFQGDGNIGSLNLGRTDAAYRNL